MTSIRSGLFAGISSLSILTPFGSVAGAAPELDVLIEHARIVDGGGNPWFRGSVGVRDGRIVHVASGPGPGPAARRVIDARDRVVAPGFIDLLGQSTTVYLTDPATAESRLRQGITTHVSGEGSSHAPQSRRHQWPITVAGKQLQWRRFSEYFALLEQYGVPLNVVHNVGAGQVRSVVIGDENRAPTPQELDQMKQLVEEAMCDGAVGLSTALIYPPSAYATTGELVELAKVAARHGGFYSTHMRNESAGLLASVEESIEIGERTGIPVHIYHLKAAGARNWPLVAQAIERINMARRGGLDVTADIYPYIRAGLGLRYFLPPWHYDQGREAARDALGSAAVRAELRAELEKPTSDWENWYQHVGGDWDKVLITDSARYGKDVAGLSVAAVAKREGRDVWDTFFDLILGGVDTAPESMDENQKRLALRQPWVMIETDTDPVNIATARSTHPRALGAFPRVLAKYVREESVLTLEEAIRRMTSLVANRLGLADRGRLAPGMAGDLVIFDPLRIRDQATFEKPLQFSEGVDYLLINGELAIDDGRLTNVLAGQVLRHKSACHAEAAVTSAGSAKEPRP